MTIKVAFANRCQWRAIYLSVVALRDKQCPYGADHQFFRIGINPQHDAIGPKLFGAIACPWSRLGFAWSWSIPLPYQPWGSWSVQRGTRVGLWLHRISSQFYFGLDGRYGRPARIV